MSATWMYRGTTLRNRRINRGRHENDEDFVHMDYTKDPSENMCEILSNITKMSGITDGRRLSYLNAFVKLVSKPGVNYDDFRYTAEEILYCLRPLSFHESTHLKNASFRAVRYFLKTEEHVDIFIKLKYDFLIARQITAAGIQLCRRVLAVCPGKFTYAPVQAMVSLTHPSHTDILQAVALAFLAEIAILNPDVFITCGGVNAIVRNLPYIKSPRMAEALLGSLLYLMNRPETRNKAGINLHCLTATAYMDRNLNTKSANNSNMNESSGRWCTTVLVSLLRSWTGILHLCQGKRRAINSVINCLYVSHLQKPMLEALYELLQLVQPEWTDEMSVALAAVDPSRWQNSFRLSEGFLTAETSALFPHLAKSRVNLVEVHLAIILYCFLEANLLDAIIHVIVSNDTFLSVRATILLGELLHMVHTILPPEVCSLTPGLPNLLSYAVRGRPTTIIPKLGPAESEGSSPQQLSTQPTPYRGGGDASYRQQLGESSSRTEQHPWTTSSDTQRDEAPLPSTPGDTQRDEAPLPSPLGDTRRDDALPNSSDKSIQNDVTLDNVESIKASVRAPGRTAPANFVDLAEIFGPEFTMEDMENALKASDNCELEVSAEAQQRALGAVCALSYLHKVLRKPPSPSLYLGHVVSWVKALPIRPRSVNVLIQTSCDDSIKESGVLSIKDPLGWHWSIIRAVLKNSGNSLRKSTDSNRRLFLRRIVNFLMPGSGGYCRMEIGSDRKQISRLTLAALDLFTTLLPAPEDSDCHKFVMELLTGIKSAVAEISTKSAHDCLLSPQNVTNALCQDYFLMLGHLSRTEQGRKRMEKVGMYQTLTDLVVSTNHDCYVKLIVSTLDYSNDEAARKILMKALESKTISSRMYATRMLHTLVRIGIWHDKSLMKFILGLVVDQLRDGDRAIAAVALNTLQEACDSKEYVEAVVEHRPQLLGLGDSGLLLLVRCLSCESGFRAMQQTNFVTVQLQKWGNDFNYRYVNIIEGLLCESMVTRQNYDGVIGGGGVVGGGGGGGGVGVGGGGGHLRHSERSNLTREAYFPPHLYQQLASHKQGLAMVLADEHVGKLVQVLENGDVNTDREMLEVKAALYALSGIAFAMDSCVAARMVHLATNCQVYSVRATAYFALSNVATTVQGAHKLHKLGWYAVRHNRHNRWPLVAPLVTDKETSYSEDDQESRDTMNTSDTGSEGHKSGLSHLPEEPSSSVEIEEFFWGIPGGKTHRVRERKSATLPHSVGVVPSFYHNRSYSESKAEASDTSDYSRYDISSGRKSRSNSYTDSSTSGDSNYGNRHYSVSERVQTLSPIPSSGSLATVPATQTRRASVLSGFSRNSLRSSRQSILKVLPQPSVYPIGLIPYGELHQLSPVLRCRTAAEIDFSAPDSSAPADFSTLDPELENSPGRGYSHSISSDQSTDMEDTAACYMGVCLPSVLGTLFPKEERNLVTNHVAFMSENLNMQGLEDLKNPSFHKEICFLGSRALHNTMISTSESDGPQYIMDSGSILTIDEREESYQDNSAASSMTDVPNVVEKPMPIIFKSPLIIRSELSRMVEQLSNPILHKTCKQSLLQIKQEHGNLFQDICVFSDVCYILSTCHIRIASREFVHELFDQPFYQIWSDCSAFLEEANARRGYRVRKSSFRTNGEVSNSGAQYFKHPVGAESL